MAELGGETLLRRAVGLFAGRAGVIVVVTSAERIGTYREHLGSIEGMELGFVEGGKERWESVMLGLKHLAQLKAAPRFVAVHDAARALTPVGVIEEAFGAVEAFGAALPVVAEPATLKRKGHDGHVLETVDRRGLYQAQTPQCFELAKLLAGYETLERQGLTADLTDDAQVYERMGWPVRMTAGSALNLKITTVEDVELARAIVAGKGR